MRTLKPRPIKEEAEGTIETFVRGSKARMPQDPKRLQKIIHAILKRIKRTNPKEALWLSGQIKGLAGDERRFPLHAPEQLACETGKRHKLMIEANKLALVLLGSKESWVLHEIEFGKVPRIAHDHSAVLLQRDQLTDYLQTHPFKIRLKYGTRDARCCDAARKWLTEYGGGIWKRLHTLPCHCGEYRDSFNDLIDSPDLSRCNGSARLIDLLLAELHVSTPDAIRKILSHAPSSAQ